MEEGGDPWAGKGPHPGRGIVVAGGDSGHLGKAAGGGLVPGGIDDLNSTVHGDTGGNVGTLGDWDEDSLHVDEEVEAECTPCDDFDCQGQANAGQDDLGQGVY